MAGNGYVAPTNQQGGNYRQSKSYAQTPVQQATPQQAAQQNAAPPQQQKTSQQQVQQNRQVPQEQISDIIAKAASSGKFIDFRNNLVQSLPKDYAMMHGIGGSKYAVKSTIKITIMDYSKAQTDGNGKPVRDSQGKWVGSHSVNANVSPDSIEMLYEVCRRFVGVQPAAQGSAQKVSANALPMVQNLLKNTQLPPSQDGRPYLAVPTEQIEQIITELSTGTSTARNATKGGSSDDFYFKQERVHAHDWNPTNPQPKPVISLQISRQSFMPNGTVKKLPWTVKIQNFLAMPIKQENGTFNYDPGSIVKESVEEAYILVSDEDMFRCLYRTKRFIETWEYAYCAKPIIDAVSRKNANRT